MTVKEPEYVYYHAGGVRGCRPVLEGPGAHDTFTSIPVVDVSGIFSHDLAERKRVAGEIGKAAREVGFFYAQNHNVPDEVVSKTFGSVQDFFALPLEKKMEVHIHKSKSLRGYEPLFETKMDPTSKGDLKEAFTMGDDGADPEQNPDTVPETPGVRKNNWPKGEDDFRRQMYAYYNAVLNFSKKMMQIFALALDLPEDYFNETTDKPMAGIRILHYPPQPTPTETNIGIGAHTDYDFFTLVCQGGVEALEVLNANGKWVPAPPKPRSFVVNIGDFLQRLTNGQFKSTVHRVVNKTGKERYSIPFFFSPNPSATLSVLPSCRVPGETYEEVNAGEYFHKRLLAARYKHPESVERATEIAAVA